MITKEDLALARKTIEQLDRYENGSPRMVQALAEIIEDVRTRAWAEGWHQLDCQRGVGNASPARIQLEARVGLLDEVCRWLRDTHSASLLAENIFEQFRPTADRERARRAGHNASKACDVCHGHRKVQHDGDDHECPECAGTGTEDPAWRASLSSSKAEVERLALAHEDRRSATGSASVGPCVASLNDPPISCDLRHGHAGGHESKDGVAWTSPCAGPAPGNASKGDGE